MPQQRWKIPHAMSGTRHSWINQSISKKKEENLGLLIWGNDTLVEIRRTKMHQLDKDREMKFQWRETAESIQWNRRMSDKSQGLKNQTWNNGLVANREKSTSSLYIVNLLT